MSHMCGHADSLSQGRMGMVNRFTDCNSIALQADGKGDFPDHVAGTGTDDGAAQYRAAGSVEKELGHSVVSTIGDGPP